MFHITTTSDNLCILGAVPGSLRSRKQAVKAARHHQQVRRAMGEVEPLGIYQGERLVAFVTAHGVLVSELVAEAPAKTVKRSAVSPIERDLAQLARIDEVRRWR